MACTGSPSTPPSPSTPTTDPAYVQQVDAWHEARVVDLKGEHGWLTLIDLVWLDEDGNYAVGGQAEHPVTVPRARADIGTLKRVGDMVVFDVLPDAGVRIDGAEVLGSVDLKPDTADGGATKVQVGDVSFHIIDRAGRLGVRLKDRQASARTEFTGVPRYPVDGGWRIDATLIPHAEPKMISIPTVIGTALDEPSPGVLRFEHGGSTHELHPIPSKSGLFLVFGDATNGAPEGSYGGGRFLSVPWDGAATRIELDFNKAINPPCAFSPHATCPLPPAENKLAIAIPAGERSTH